MTQEPATEAALDVLFAALERSPRALLMLDYDGTLAPFRNDPNEAVPYPGVREVLDAIMRNDRTRVVLISGRRAVDVMHLLKTHVRPEVWGCHGWERMQPSGALSILPAPAQALEALIDASGVADSALRLGARLERKPSSLALHWRGLSEERAREVRAIVEPKWQDLCARAPLALLEFDGGLELRASGRSKANAVLTALAESGFDTPAAFLGDDITDEDAFAALNGRALSVLVRNERRPSAASVWLRPPEALLAFLQRWQRARTTGPSSGGRAS